MKANKITLEHAKKDKLFYFVANVIVYRKKDKKCLILKRSETEKTHPGKYCVPGGKLEWKDLDINKPTRLNGDVIDFENQLEKLLARETFEEAGIKIKQELKYINNVVFIRPDGIPVVLVKFASEYESGEIKLEDSFTDFAWVDEKEVKKYDCIQGIAEEIKETIKIFNNKNE